MAFPFNSTPLDQFNRANSGTLGGNWGGKLFSGDSSGCSIVSNQAQCNATQSDYYSVTTFGPDCEVFATLPILGAAGLFARVSNPGTGTFTGYEVYAPTTVLQVYRIDNGSYVQLGADIAQTISTGDSLGIEIVGTTITVYYKVGAGAWTSVATRTDATYSSAGYIGFEGDSGGFLFEDFGGGTLGTVVGAPLGFFDYELRQVAWFDWTQVVQGWFDRDLINAVAGSATVIPSTLALVTSSFAPVITTTVTPSTAGLSLTAFAPTVGQKVTPTTVALATTSFAPQIVSSVTPTTASLVTSTFAPLISTTVIPTTASLSTVTFAPVISSSVTPTTATLTTTGFAPVIDLRVIPTTLALALTTFAPTIGTVVTPDPATLTLTTFAPTVIIGTNVVPDPAVLTITSFAPELPTSLVVPAATLVITTFAPDVLGSGGVTVVPDPASLTLTGFQPTLPSLVTPTTASLALATFAPTVTGTGGVTVQPSTLLLVITTFAPDVIVGFPPVSAFPPVRGRITVVGADDRSTGVSRGQKETSFARSARSVLIPRR